MATANAIVHVTLSAATENSITMPGNCYGVYVQAASGVTDAEVRTATGGAGFSLGTERLPILGSTLKSATLYLFSTAGGVIQVFQFNGEQ